MVRMLKNSYHPNDSRVIAHNNVVQQIQTGGTESRGLNFEAEEDAMTMIVQLCFVCTGNVRVTEDLKKWAKLCTVAKHIFNSIRSTLAK
jgi:azurin